MKAGLPNILADNISRRNVTETGNGAIKTTGNPSQPKYQGGTATYLTSGDFNAGNYNSIYGNSNTVTPLSLKTMVFIKY